MFWLVGISGTCSQTGDGRQKRADRRHILSSTSPQPSCQSYIQTYPAESPSHITPNHSNHVQATIRRGTTIPIDRPTRELTINPLSTAPKTSLRSFTRPRPKHQPASLHYSSKRTRNPPRTPPKTKQALTMPSTRPSARNSNSTSRKPRLRATSSRTS